MRSKIRTLFDSIFLNIFWVLTSDNLQSEWSVFKALCKEVLKTYAGSPLICDLGHVQGCVCIVFSLIRVLSYVQEWLLLCKAIFRISSAYVYRTLHGNRVKKQILSSPSRTKLVLWCKSRTTEMFVIEPFLRYI